MISVSPCIVGLIPADTRLNDRSTVTCVLLARQIAVRHNLPGSLTCTCAVCPRGHHRYGEGLWRKWREVWGWGCSGRGNGDSSLTCGDVSRCTSYCDHHRKTPFILSHMTPGKQTTMFDQGACRHTHDIKHRRASVVTFSSALNCTRSTCTGRQRDDVIDVVCHLI